MSAVLLLVLSLAQQPVPQPFPRPGSPQRPAPPTQTTPAQPAPAQPAPAQQTPPSLPPASAQTAEGTPSQASLGVPVYPAATYLATFDAGQGQRYYLFGTNASFAEIVAYYKTYLKQRGNEVFENDPPTHVFEMGRFREETMAYPPGITVKDYTWNGGQGYLHVKAGAAPQRFKTVIQIVPPAPTAEGR